MNKKIDEAIKFLLVEFTDNQISEIENNLEAKERWELWRQKIISIKHNKEKFIKCPFCAKDYFDLTKLKYHLLMYCKEFNEIDGD